MAVRVTIDKAAVAEVCRRHHVRELSLFGSVLRNDFSTESDIDVLYEFEPGRHVGFDIFRVEEELSAALGGRKVDLVPKKYLNRWMRDRVLASAQVLYAAA